MRHKILEGFMAGVDSKGREEEADELPGHVEKMSHGGYACMYCGGEVDTDGQRFGEEGAEDDDEHKTPQESFWSSKREEA